MTSAYLDRPLRSEAEAAHDAAIADRVFRTTYGYAPGRDEHDQARLAGLARVLRDIRLAGFAVVEGEDGR